MSGSEIQASHEPLTGELFAARSAATPKAVAVISGAVRLSYQEVEEGANRVAHRLIAAGAGPDTVVGVCLGRGPDLIPVLHGIWKAGAAYLPLDPALPTERITYMLSDARAPLLVTESAHAERAAGFPGTTVLLDDGHEAAAVPTTDPGRRTDPDQLAYVLYTSGSTGRPKGVMISHRALLNLLASVRDDIAPARRATWLASTSISFDISGLELHLPLITGGRVVLASDAQAKDAAALVGLVDSHRVTHVQATPSGWRLLLAAGFDNYAVTALAGGEPVTPQLAADLQDKVQRLVNVYGPTETTIWSTFWEIPENTGTISIGAPLANTGVHVLTEDLRQVPPGVPGQLHLDGTGLARGYFDRAGLTAEKFVPNPHGPAGSRLYRTGDLARFLPDGTLECLGRIDNQVKIRGHRIELGEIEARLREHAGVGDAVVTVKESAAGEKSLVAYVVPVDGGVPDTNSLRMHLAQALPDYMVPAAFVSLDAIPLTVNGKVDHRALPVPDLAAFAGERFVAPRTPVEERLAAVWADVLGLDRVGVEDSFFDLGGDSIRAVRLVGALRAAGFDVSIPDVFGLKTVAALGVLVGGGDVGGVSLVETVEPFALIGGRDRDALPGGVVDAYPLSQVQTGMLVEMLASGEERVYQNINSFRIPDAEAFCEESLRAAVEVVVARHDILRTSMRLDGFSQPLQLVHGRVEVPVGVWDLRGLSEGRQREAARAYVEGERAAGFELTAAPLLRIAVHVESDDAWRLTVGYQHAIADGWTLNSLLMELLECYRSLRGGSGLPVYEVPAVRFADFIAAEQASLADPGDQAYWLDVVEGHSPAQLPTAWARPEAPRELLHTRIPYSDLEDGLKHLAAQARTSLKSVLLAAHLKVLGMLTAEDAFHTGVVYHGRLEAPGADRVLGMHLNTLPFPALKSARTWRELVEQVYRQETEIWARRRYPLPAIQRAAGNNRDLLTILFEYLDFHLVDRTTVDTGATLGDGSNEFALNAIASNGGFSLVASSAVIDGEHLDRLGGMYRSVLEAMAADVDGDARGVFLSEAERGLLLGAWAQGGTAVWPGGLVVDRFEAQVAAAPDAVAVVVAADGTRLSYREVDERANRIARHLIAGGVGPDQLVGVCLERGPDLVPVLLGIWKAGAAYLPLDPTLPAERLAFILADTDTAVVVTESASTGLLDGFGGRCVVVDTDAEAIRSHSAVAPTRTTDPAQLAYVIYTSGSTGRPKGVMIHHAGLANYLAWTVEAYAGHGTGGAPLFSSISFDLGIPDLFTPLVCGQPVTLLPDDLDVADLGVLLDRFGPYGFVKLTPGHLDLLTHQLDAAQAARLAGLVIAAGDNFPVTLAERWRELAGADGTKVATEYGPTEITIGNSGLVIDEVQVTEAVPLGAPIPHTQMYVLDAALEPVPVGVTGEVHIAGTGLARGYLGRPGLTAEKFLPNPHGPAGSRLYRTGDLARFLPDGTLETLGRIDHQVKIRGYRIELGEIEARLREHPHLKDAAVTVRTAGTGEKSLVAYAVVAEDSALDVTVMRAHLADTLPPYMIPAAFMAIDAIPLTTNGKVDHRALPAPDPTISTTQRYVAPRTPVEEKLAGIWSDVLGVERVGAEDNFFELGGDSIRAVQVLSACRAAGLGLAVWMVLQAKTLSELAAMVPVGGPNGDHGDGMPLTPSQLRLIDQGASGGRTVRLALSAQPDVGLLDRALRAVVNHHQALRLVPTEDGRAVEGEAGAALVVPLDLRSVPDGLRRAAIGRAVAEAGAALEPAHGALVRGTLVRVDDEKPDELWLTVHALAADEGSWPTIVADLNSAYRALVSGAAADLEPVATPWRTWAEQLAEQARSESLPDLAEYWLGRPPAAVLPLDRPDGRDNDTEATARSLTVVLPAEPTALLLAGPEPEHLLLTSLGRVLADWSGGERVEVDVVSDPRRDEALGAALSRTVGPLADRHPVSLRLPKGRDLAGSVRSVGRQLRAVPSFAQAYGLLRHLAADSELAAELGRSPAPQVGFRFTPAAVTKAERSSDVPLVFAPAHIAPAAAPDAPRPHLLEVDARVQDDQLYLRWTYGECVHDAGTVRGLADAQLRELTEFLGQSGGRPAHPAHATHQAAASDAVTELMTLHRIPGASIALIHNGEVTSVRAFGTLGVDDPTPVTEDTLFAAGSISKHVTTFALLRLVSDGLVELDRDINDYLRSWKVPPGPEPVTAASLLANQAGLAPHPARDDYYHRYDPVPTVLDVLHGRPPAKTPPVRRRDAPGEVFKLSPLNFSVLQQAMTDLTGEPFPELVGRLLFEPLGMTASGFDSVFPDTSGRLFARGHRADGTPVPDGFVIHPETAAGGLWTTAGDLARLGLEIRRCHLGRPGGLVDAGLVRRMLTPQAGRNYGWSTILDDTGGDLEFGHGGQATGYQAMTGLRAQSGTGAVLLSNAAGGRELVRHLLATVWSGQHHLAHLWQQAIDEATARERDGHRKDAAK